jgi:murein L,D-transpeptidase YcbB/YkuD
MSMPVAGASAVATPRAEVELASFSDSAGPGADGWAVGDQIAQQLAQPGADPVLADFYAARGDRPLWTAEGRIAPEAMRLIDRLSEARADGLNPADYRPDDLRATVRAARSGRPEDLAAAELALSAALANWASDLHRPQSGVGMLYSDPQLRPPQLSRAAALNMMGEAPSLQAGIARASRMNPIYTRLRAALKSAPPGPHADLLRANLERARALPVDLGRRYVLVDIAAQRLWMYDQGRPVDTMKVVVGKPSEPTPAMAALIRYAVFRPYWNVPPDLVAHGMAPKVLKQGLGYFHAQRLQALSSWNDAQAKPMNPARVNWRAVASGKVTLRVRQLPGPDNMMGQVKFMFPNPKGVYLHDSPLRRFFAGDQRLASAGCVRLEDASRLGRWLLGEAAVQQGEQPGPPETKAYLSKPVPVYLTYLTAAPTGQGLSVRKDIYNRDPALIAQLERSANGPQLASR